MLLINGFAEHGIASADGSEPISRQTVTGHGSQALYTVHLGPFWQEVVRIYYGTLAEVLNDELLSWVYLRCDAKFSFVNNDHILLVKSIIFVVMIDEKSTFFMWLYL